MRNHFHLVVETANANLVPGVNGGPKLVRKSRFEIPWFPCASAQGGGRQQGAGRLWKERRKLPGMRGNTTCEEERKILQ
jgi:hypothetical protein